MKKILLIEDDFAFQRITKRTLEKNYSVDISSSAAEFYANYSKNNYDLIIMDISLKGEKDGLQLTKEIKKMTNFIDVPILCVTSYVQSVDRKNAFSAGVDFFLSKPVNYEVLARKIEEIVGEI